jgi:hypothetical protein
MKTDRQTDVLECMHQPYNRGGRERTPIHAEMAPVHGSTTIVSLPHACLAAGLLTDACDGSVVNWPILTELARKQWEGRVERFLGDAEEAGISPEEADRWAGAKKGAVIGWAEPYLRSTDTGRIPFQICTDGNAALAILGRCVGDIFFADRQPDYGWEVLFEHVFAFDEDLAEAAGLECEPWTRFEWDVEN